MRFGSEPEIKIEFCNSDKLRAGPVEGQDRVQSLGFSFPSLNCS